MLSRASALVAVILIASSALAEEFPPNDAPSEKQSPLGFGAIQAVKSLTSSENDDFVKRAPMGFQGMRGKKDTRQDIADNSLSEIEEFEKRAPMGFHGMRGKKDYLTPDIAESYFVDEYLKRAPMGFQGMRGKKAITEEDYYKRAAMGFQGMRGKKSLDLMADELARYGESRGKIANLFDYTNEYEKRAPSMGFQGMRGKRNEFEDELSKRAPMGFQGMRGKKSFLEEINDLEKRAMMGFQGMRGKKSISSLDYAGFRPERSVSVSGLTDMQSKKPKKRLGLGFIGARGKRSDLSVADDYSKMSTNELQDALADELAEDLFLRDSLRFRPERSVSVSGLTDMQSKKPKKRLGLGFIGARGKRSDLLVADDYSKMSTYEMQDALADELAEDLFLRDSLADRVNLLPLQFNKRSAYGNSAGTRGKKIPRWEIRGKFVGVRGKKAEISPNNVHRNNERIGVADSTTNLDLQ